MLHLMLAAALVTLPDPADVVGPAPATPVTAPVVDVAPAAPPMRADDVVTAHDAPVLLVGALSAFGGVVGLGTTAVAGIAIGSIASSVTAGAAAPLAFATTVLMLPVGAGVGAMGAHALAHSDGAIGAGLAGAAGTVLGALAGGGVGFFGGLALSGESAGSWAVVIAFAYGVLGAGAGALLGAGAGPLVHAMVEE